MKSTAKRGLFRFRRELLIVTGVYFLLICWFFGKAFLTEYLSGDWVRFWVPSYYFVLSNLKEGIFPLWQPYQYMGVPAALHPGYMIFYPLLWGVLLFNLLINHNLNMNILGKTFELYFYLHILVGGIGTYLLLRDYLNLNKLSSFIGGFIFMFSIFTVSNFDPTLIGKMYLPWLIYLLLQLLEKKKFIYFLLWIMVNFFIFTLGYPYYQIYFFYAQLFLGILYGLRASIGIVVGLGISVLLSSIVLLPQVYYYTQAGRITEAQQAVFHITSSPIPTYLLNVLIPSGIYFNNLLFWGTIPLMFLLVGFANLKLNKFSIWLIVVFVISIILGMGGYLGIQDVFGGPPFFLDKLRSHGQIFILTFFCGVVIISQGIDSAMRGIKNEKIENGLWIFFGLIIALLLLLPLQQNNYLSENKASLIGLGRFILLFFSGIILYYFITRFKSKLLVVILIVLTFLEFHYYYSNTEQNKLGATYNNYFTRNSLIPELPSKDNLFRYEFWNDQFMYHTSHLRVFSSSGYDGIPYASMYDIARFPIPQRYQFANVKYVVTTDEQNYPEYKLLDKVDPATKPSETIYSTEEGHSLFTGTSKNVHYVYEVKNYLPRFYVPSIVKTCTNKDCYKNEKPPKLVYTKDNDINIKNPPTKNVSIIVEAYSPNNVVLQVNTPKETFISSSEIWDKGWSATINDKKASVINVSNGFRGFIVPTGKSTIKMDYFPPYFGLGGIFSALGIILIIFMYKYRNRFFLHS